jgi:NADH:ubiquinone oxidoreductase subunit 5 (subunit L)/multisubunit Na+/H+ antiporter MnhA subunit
MIWPLVSLAVGAIFAGYLNFPRHLLGDFLGQSPSMIASYHMSAHRYAPDGVEIGDPSEVINPVPFGQPDPRPEMVRETEHRAHYYMMLFSGLLALVGWWLARQFHLRDRDAPERIARRVPSLVRLLQARYWVDEVYQRGIVEPLRRFGVALFAFDRMVIDGIIWAIGFVPQATGFGLKLSMQRGYLQGYALAMAVGIAVILVIVFVF